MASPNAGQAFVPDSFDGTSYAAIEPLVQSLLSRKIANASELEKWITDRSELAAACGEVRALLYIVMTCNTEDAAAQRAYGDFVEHVAPRLTEAAFELDKRLAALVSEHKLPRRYDVLVRNARADVELFRKENIPLDVQLAKLSQQYDQIAGSQMVQFDGQERTLAQMGRYQEQTDRTVREAAWRAAADRRMRDADAIDGVYDAMIGLRNTVAKNAGCASYTEYAFKSYHRFDYSVRDCERFHAGVEAAIVPLMRRLEGERAKALGVSPLRPWDLSVDVKGRDPLRPFEGGADLVAKTQTVMRRLDGGLAALFEEMGDGAGRVRNAGDLPGTMLDLDSRPGKAPGGYQYMLDRSKKPFIFMNAAGLQKDVETMVHEAGHAFHSMLCNDEPLTEYRSAPTEFAEVASMSMELLTMRHMGPGAGRAFYDDAENFRRSMRQQLKRSILLLPWIATIDAFQHWVYANPKHTRAEREKFWLALDERFGSAVSWQGIERVRATTWHRQLHLFSHPFYYIEYGIAQLGALQLWLQSLEHGESHAIVNYKRALALGGSKPLPELFSAADLTFDFGPESVSRLAERVRLELEKVPE